MEKSKIINYKTSAGGIGLASFARDGIVEFIMNVHPLLSLALFLVFLALFLWGLLPSFLDYVRAEKVEKWKIVLIYVMPILIISFGFSGLLSKYKIKNKLTPTSKLKSFRNLHFYEENVRLDGNRFVGCTFEDVTFIWENDNFELFAAPGTIKSSKFAISNHLVNNIISLFHATSECSNKRIPLIKGKNDVAW